MGACSCSCSGTAELAATAFPLFFVATSAVCTVLAAPFGHAADRVGRRTVFLLGHGLLLGAYATALLGRGWLAAAACLVCLGAFYAATGGVVTALAAERCRRSAARPGSRC